MPTQEEFDALKNELEAQKVINATNSKNIAKQNSYITTLESQTRQGTPAKEPEVKPSATTSNLNPVLTDYVMRNLKRDTIEEAEKQLKTEMSLEQYEAIKPELMEFLNKNMTEEYITVPYIVDACSLILGKCLRNKDHAIHKVLNKTTTQPQSIGTNSDAIRTVQNTVLNKTPPIMTSADAGASTGAPNTQLENKSTKDAFVSLRQKLSGVNGGRFA